MPAKFSPAVVALGLITALANIPAAHAAVSYTTTVENTPGLLAYYQFNSTSSSVNGYTGTLTAGASVNTLGSGPAIADDPTNPALLLDGTPGNELQSSLGSGVSTAGSMIAWINIAQLPSDAKRFFYIAGQSANGDDFDLQIQNNDDKIYFYTDTGGNVTSSALAGGDVNKWIFIAATFTQNSDRNLYINGTLVAADVPGAHHDSGSLATPNPFTIGYSNVFGGRSFDGAIDEVAFFNTDLSATQVADIYASAAGLSTPEPASLSVLCLGLLTFFSRRKRTR